MQEITLAAAFAIRKSSTQQTFKVCRDSTFLPFDVSDCICQLLVADQLFRTIVCSDDNPDNISMRCRLIGSLVHLPALMTALTISLCGASSDITGRRFQKEERKKR